LASVWIRAGVRIAAAAVADIVFVFLIVGDESYGKIVEGKKKKKKKRQLNCARLGGTKKKKNLFLFGWGPTIRIFFWGEEKKNPSAETPAFKVGFFFTLGNIQYIIIYQ
jgi:hypothetical protein